MSVRDDVNKVNQKISNIYDRRRAAAYAISLRYAGLALQYFRREQSRGAFWENQTGSARDLVFSDGFIELLDSVGWFIAHGVEYGVYLELANNRQNESLRPILQRFAGRYIRDIKELYGDT